MYGEGSGIELYEFHWKVGLLGIGCFLLWILLIAIVDHVVYGNHKSIDSNN